MAALVPAPAPAPAKPRRRTIYHISKPHRRYDPDDETHYPAWRERRKYAQVYLSQSDIVWAIQHLRDHGIDYDVPPAKTESVKNEATGQVTVEKRYAHLLWRRRPKYSLHVVKTPRMTFYKRGVETNPGPLTDQQRAEIVKHVNDQSIPHPDSDIYKRFWRKIGLWEISAVATASDLLVRHRGEMVTERPASEDGEDAARPITQEEKMNAIKHLLNGTTPEPDETGRWLFQTERTFPKFKHPLGQDTNHVPLYVIDPDLSSDEKQQKRMVVPTEAVKSKIRAAYQDPKQRTGPQRLFKRLAERYVGIPRKAVNRFLKRQPTYQVHQPLPNNRVLHHVIKTTAPYEQWQADLVDVQKIKGENQGRRYILTVVDLFSKRAFARALLNKNADTVANAFGEIIEKDANGHMPELVQTDNGSEFISKDFNTKLDELWRKNDKPLLYMRGEEEIARHIYSAAYKPTTQGAVERFNRTLKNMVYSNMTETEGVFIAGGAPRKTKRMWYDLLGDFIINYNNNISYSTGFKPDELHFHLKDLEHKTAAQQAEIKRRWVKAKERMEKRSKHLMESRRREKDRQTFKRIKVGDTVRVSRMAFSQYRRNAQYRRGYLRNWSEAVFVVARIQSAPEEQRQNNPDWSFYSLYLLADPSHELVLPPIPHGGGEQKEQKEQKEEKREEEEEEEEEEKEQKEEKMDKEDEEREKRHNEKKKKEDPNPNPGEWKWTPVKRSLIAGKRKVPALRGAVAAVQDVDVHVWLWRRRLYREDLLKISSEGRTSYEKKVIKGTAELGKYLQDQEEKKETQRIRSKDKREQKRQEPVVPRTGNRGPDARRMTPAYIQMVGDRNKRRSKNTDPQATTAPAPGGSLAIKQFLRRFGMGRTV